MIRFAKNGNGVAGEQGRACLPLHNKLEYDSQSGSGLHKAAKVDVESRGGDGAKRTGSSSTKTGLVHSSAEELRATSSAPLHSLPFLLIVSTQKAQNRREGT